MRLSKKNGFSLVEVLVASGLLTIAGLGVVQLANQQSQGNLQQKAIRVSMGANAQIMAAINNRAAWIQTMINNESFSCMTRVPGCTPSSVNGGYYDFVLYGPEPRSKLSYDPSDATTRVSLAGGGCAANVPDPSELCPLKFRGRWKPICATYPCLNPTVDIRFDLATDFKSDVALNARKYDVSAIKGPGDDPVQAACTSLNGIYNSVARSCFPKYSGMTCASIGKPYQIVTAVHADGSIECQPLYHGLCNSATQRMSGIDSTGGAICGPKGAVSGCAVNCRGAWSACSSSCNGTQRYNILTAAQNGGTACPFAAGATQACNTRCPVNCVGNWTACTAPCGGGTQTFVISRPASGGGLACVNSAGDVRACNTAACGLPVNCAGTWSSCNSATGTRTFNITQFPSGGGTSCPPSPQSCTVDCVGSWGACNAGVRTYSYSVTPKNGGAACPYANNQTDSSACATCSSYGFEVCHSVTRESMGGRSGFPTLAACQAGRSSYSNGNWYPCGTCECMDNSAPACRVVVTGPINVAKSVANCLPPPMTGSWCAGPADAGKGYTCSDKGICNSTTCSDGFQKVCQCN